MLQFYIKRSTVRLPAGRRTQAGDATDQWRHRWNAATVCPTQWRLPAALKLVDCRESSTLINHMLKGTKNSAIDWIHSSPGCLGATCEARWTWSTFSRRRYVGVFLAVCDGAPSCCRHPGKMPALLLQDVTVSLDNNWDNKHVVSCC